MKKSKRDLVTELADSNPCYKEVSKMLDMDVVILLDDHNYKNTCSVIFTKDEMRDALDQAGKPDDISYFNRLVKMAVYCWSYLNDMYCTVLSMTGFPVSGCVENRFVATVEVNFFD